MKKNYHKLEGSVVEDQRSRARKPNQNGKYPNAKWEAKKQEEEANQETKTAANKPGIALKWAKERQAKVPVW